MVRGGVPECHARGEGSWTQSKVFRVTVKEAALPQARGGLEMGWRKGVGAEEQQFGFKLLAMIASRDRFIM